MASKEALTLYNSGMSEQFTGQPSTEEKNSGSKPKVQDALAEVPAVRQEVLPSKSKNKPKKAAYRVPDEIWRSLSKAEQNQVKTLSPSKKREFVESYRSAQSGRAATPVEPKVISPRVGTTMGETPTEPEPIAELEVTLEPPPEPEAVTLPEAVAVEAITDAEQAAEPAQLVSVAEPTPEVPAVEIPRATKESLSPIHAELHPFEVTSEPDFRHKLHEIWTSLGITHEEIRPGIDRAQLDVTLPFYEKAKDGNHLKAASSTKFHFEKDFTVPDPQFSEQIAYKILGHGDHTNVDRDSVFRRYFGNLRVVDRLREKGRVGDFAVAWWLTKKRGSVEISIAPFAVIPDKTGEYEYVLDNTPLIKPLKIVAPGTIYEEPVAAPAQQELTATEIPFPSENTEGETLPGAAHVELEPNEAAEPEPEPILEIKDVKFPTFKEPLVQIESNEVATPLREVVAYLIKDGIQQLELPPRANLQNRIQRIVEVATQLNQAFTKSTTTLINASASAREKELQKRWGIAIQGTDDERVSRAIEVRKTWPKALGFEVKSLIAAELRTAFSSINAAPLNDDERMVLLDSFSPETSNKTRRVLEKTEGNAISRIFRGQQPDRLSKLWQEFSQELADLIPEVVNPYEQKKFLTYTMDRDDAVSEQHALQTEVESLRTSLTLAARIVARINNINVSPKKGMDIQSTLIDWALNNGYQFQRDVYSALYLLRPQVIGSLQLSQEEQAYIVQQTADFTLPANAPFITRLKTFIEVYAGQRTVDTLRSKWQNQAANQSSFLQPDDATAYSVVTAARGERNILLDANQPLDKKRTVLSQFVASSLNSWRNYKFNMGLRYQNLVQGQKHVDVHLPDDFFIQACEVFTQRLEEALPPENMTALQNFISETVKTLGKPSELNPIIDPAVPNQKMVGEILRPPVSNKNQGRNPNKPGQNPQQRVRQQLTGNW